MPIKDMFGAFRSRFQNRDEAAGSVRSSWQDLRCEMEEAAAYHHAMRQMSMRKAEQLVDIRANNIAGSKLRPSLVDLKQEIDGILDVVAGNPEYEPLFLTLKDNMFGRRVSMIAEANRSGELDALKQINAAFKERVDNITTAYESMSTEDQTEFNALSDKEYSTLVTETSTDKKNNTLNVPEKESIPEPVSDADRVTLRKELNDFTNQMKEVKEYKDLYKSLAGQSVEKQIAILDAKKREGRFFGTGGGELGEEVDGLVNHLENMRGLSTNKVAAIQEPAEVPTEIPETRFSTSMGGVFGDGV